MCTHLIVHFWLSPLFKQRAKLDWLNHTHLANLTGNFTRWSSSKPKPFSTTGGGHVDILLLLIRQGANPHRHINGSTRKEPESGIAKDVQELELASVDAGLRVESSYIDGYTPLMLTSSFGQSQTIEVLIQWDIGANRIDQNGPTPLNFVSFITGEGNSAAAQTLIAAGPYIDSPEKEGKMSMACAAFHGNLGTAKVVVKAGADRAAVLRRWL